MILKMKTLIKKILFPFFGVFAKYYFAKPRYYRYKEIKVTVLPDVFFPHFTISTKLLLQFLGKKNLSGKSLLELGCGTGIISVMAAKKGSQVSASDVNPAAIENTQLNAKNNLVEVITYLSDIFTNIPAQQFDFIIINPPYYPKAPQNMAEEAWYCGEDFEYFEKLFSSILPWFHINSHVLMILSEDCQIARINDIAAKNNLKLTTVLEKKKYGEMNYIFRLKSV